MSWQSYIDDHLMCDVEGNHLTSAAILGQDGSVWAQSSNFPQVKPEEVKGILKDFKEPGHLAPTGLFLGGAKYMVIQGEAAVANVRDLSTWWQMYNTGQGGAGSPFRAVVAYRDSYVGPLRLGAYSYHIPRSMQDFVSKPFCQIDYPTNTVIDVWWEIEDPSVVNVYACRSVNTGSNDGLTGQGCDGWLTIATHLEWTTDNKWPTADFVDVNEATWVDGLQHLRFVPRGMSNKYHGPTIFASLFRQAKLAAKKYLMPAIRVGGRAIAEHLAGQSPLMSSGVKLLADAYGIGNEITSKLNGGGQ